MTDTIVERTKRVAAMPLVGKGALMILGGEFAAERLEDFFGAWQFPRDDMPWGIWEYLSHVEVGRIGLTESAEQVERARIFGAGGDLDVRRDEGRVLWRFVGPSGANVPANLATEFAARDFWEAEPWAQYRVFEELRLLWGKKEPDAARWLEDRLGGATIQYHGLEAHERVYVTYEAYVRDGVAEFVWLRELGGARGGQHA